MATLVLVGCGNMGGALLGGWLAEGWPADAITVVEPSAAHAETIAKTHGVNVVASADALATDMAPDLVVLAVKPQVMAEVLAPYARFGDHATFVSVAAGCSMSAIAAHVGENAAVVRAMPNTPALVGRGISVAVANANVSDAGRKAAGDLLAAVGTVEWVDDEALLDAVTGVSGSGPAYIFAMAEALAHGGVMAGLSVELAEKLARATVAGAGEMLHQRPESAETLRNNVTSPGGTTAAALDVLLRADGLKALLVEAVDAATRRSRELGQ